MQARLQRLPLKPWRRFLGAPRPSEHETLYVTTRDGVRLAIHRVRPSGPGQRRAVLLLHGLGANAFGFLMPRRSLAEWLAARGYDCYVPSLRGAGESDTAGWSWDLDDYVEQDLPAILEGIRAASGQREVDWIGHSMGGILLCCYAIRNEDHGVRRGVAIGSALDYASGQSSFQRLYALRSLIERIPVVPFGVFSHAVAPLLGRVASPVETFNFHVSNVEPETIRAIYANAFEWIPTSLLKSLATTFEPGGLCSRDGSVRYLECAGRFRAPLLLLSGSADVQCPAEAIDATARVLAGQAQVRRFGTAHGHQDDYGHFDLIVGRRAPEEVWPVIADFLRAN